MELLHFGAHARDSGKGSSFDPTKTVSLFLPVLFRHAGTEKMSHLLLRPNRTLSILVATYSRVTSAPLLTCLLLSLLHRPRQRRTLERVPQAERAIPRAECARSHDVTKNTNKPYARRKRNDRRREKMRAKTRKKYDKVIIIRRYTGKK